MHGLYVADATEYRGTGERWAKAHPLFVSPDDNVNWRLGRYPCTIKRAHDLESSQNSVNAIEFSTVGLGIKVTACRHRRFGIIPSRAARVDITDLIEADVAPGICAPVDEKIASSLVIGTERRAAAAAVCQCADLRHLHQASKESVLVDRQFRVHPRPSSQSGSSCLSGAYLEPVVFLSADHGEKLYGATSLQ